MNTKQPHEYRPGDRVRDVGSGATGTVEAMNSTTPTGFVPVRWDDTAAEPGWNSHIWHRLIEPADRTE